MKSVLIFVFTVLGVPAMSCHASPPPGGWTEQPVRTAADGSFARDIEEVTLTGIAPVDLGGGMVGQRLIWQRLCRDDQQLLFVDCNQREAAVVDGLVDEERSEGIETSSFIDLIQHPRGALKVDEIGSVAELVQTAKTNGYSVHEISASPDVMDEFLSTYPVFNGCKIHYPNSAGATQ
ncbi:hypothetical protein [Yoonia sp. BS5-3]|uniref:Uncharacterized protein n=1 Tax=Yoonia phaeophyticola TaxID=3137369 RepID=A0ABZ2V2E5_9RHOB